MPDCEAKDHWFDSQSGHKPGLQAWSPVEGPWEATTHWRFSPSLPLSLKMNKSINQVFKIFICRKTSYILSPSPLIAGPYMIEVAPTAVKGIDWNSALPPICCVGIMIVVSAVWFYCEDSSTAPGTWSCINVHYYTVVIVIRLFLVKLIE